MVEACSDADILVFVIPHQFIGRVCDTVKGKIKADALGMSLIKVRGRRLLPCDTPSRGRCDYVVIMSIIDRPLFLF